MVSGTCCSTSFPGLSPTRPTVGRVGENPGDEVACCFAATLQLGFQETLYICLQILFHYLLDHLKHCSDLCAMVYSSATGIYKGDSLVHSHLTRKMEIL